MESGFNGATFSQIVNTALYIVSGFFFGIFASRNSLFSVIRIRNAFIEKDFSLTSVFGIAFSVLFFTHICLWYRFQRTVPHPCFSGLSILAGIPDYGRRLHLLRRVAFLFFQRLEKSVRKVKKRETSRFFHCCNIGKYNIPVSISGIPRCRDGTKLPWQSLPPEMYSLWRRQK